MGSVVAAGYADEVAAGRVDLPVVVTAHLRVNLWPPRPKVFVPFAVRAIELASAGDWDVEVQLPDGVALQERTTGKRRGSLSAQEAVEWLRLNAFVSAVAG